MLDFWKVYYRKVTWEDPLFLGSIFLIRVRTGKSQSSRSPFSSAISQDRCNILLIKQISEIRQILINCYM